MILDILLDYIVFDANQKKITLICINAPCFG